MVTRQRELLTYEVEENNEWWGKGFTEWNTVKAAKKYRHDLNSIPISFVKYLSQSESLLSFFILSVPFQKLSELHGISSRNNNMFSTFHCRINPV